MPRAKPPPSASPIFGRAAGSTSTGRPGPGAGEAESGKQAAHGACSFHDPSLPFRLPRLNGDAAVVEWSTNVSDEQTACQVPVCSAISGIIRTSACAAAPVFRRRRDRTVAAQSERAGNRAHDRGASGRRAHHRARLLRARPAHAHGVPFVDARRRRPEPHRLRSRARSWGSFARRSCSTRARSTARSSSLHGRSILVLRKTAAETLQKWGHDRILGDVVWVIRNYRPDVIILGFYAARRATVMDSTRRPRFSARRHSKPRPIPKRFPSNCSTSSRGARAASCCAGTSAGLPAEGAAADAEGQAEGGAAGGRGARRRRRRPPPPLAQGRRGRNRRVQSGAWVFVRRARRPEPQHASQPGHGRDAPARRRGHSEFELVGGEPASKDLFDGIDTSWNRLPGGAAVAPILAEAIRAYEPAHPEKALPFLAKARPLIAAIADPLAKVKLAELDESIALCAGLWAEAQARQPDITPGAPLTVTTTLVNRSHAALALRGRGDGRHVERAAARTRRRSSHTTSRSRSSSPSPCPPRSRIRSRTGW